MKKYRDQGAVGALLDEYERALHDLQQVIQEVSPQELVTIADSDTADPDCRSIQTILTHVLRAGYNYVVEIRKHQGENLSLHRPEHLDTVSEYQSALEAMFAYNAQLFIDYPDLKLEQYEPSDKFRVKWGQVYDVEQLFEHAIVHILRHRRQIERFLLKLRA